VGDIDFTNFCITYTAEGIINQLSWSAVTGPNSKKKGITKENSASKGILLIVVTIFTSDTSLKGRGGYEGMSLNTMGG
jgi:hypothetical protein